MAASEAFIGFSDPQSPRNAIDTIAEYVQERAISDQAKFEALVARKAADATGRPQA